MTFLSNVELKELFTTPEPARYYYEEYQALPDGVGFRVEGGLADRKVVLVRYYSSGTSSQPIGKVAKTLTELIESMADHPDINLALALQVRYYPAAIPGCLLARFRDKS